MGWILDGNAPASFWDLLLAYMEIQAAIHLTFLFGLMQNRLEFGVCDREQVIFSVGKHFKRQNKT